MPPRPRSLTTRLLRARWLRALVVLCGVLLLAFGLTVEIGGRYVVRGRGGEAPPGPRRGERLVPHATGTLAVEVLEGPASASDTVFVIHGVGWDRSRMAPIGAALVADGHRVVMVDLPAHGRSSPGYVSFGVHEGHALSAALDQLEREHAVVGMVKVLGYSLGAATAIQWAGYDSRVRAVVALAPFRSLRAIAPAFARQFPPFIVQLAVSRGAMIAGFDPEEASAERAIARTTAAVLLLHGREDQNIAFGHSEAIFASRPQQTTIVPVTADHQSIVRDPAVLQLARAWLLSVKR